jgi:hypothetical protein
VRRGPSRSIGGRASRDRGQQMTALREQGYTLDEIAARFEVSRERVRQLLGAHAPDADQVADARRRRAEQQAQARVDELIVLWRTGRTLPDVADALGLQAAAARRAITSRATEADRVVRRASLASARQTSNRYSDDDIVDALCQVAAQLGRAPRAKEYAALARVLHGPSLPTVLIRMEGWTAALRAAGIVSPHGPARVSSRRWTVEACWSALNVVVGELDAIPTVARYDRHARGRDDVPSSATIRNRLGRWSAITAQLAAERARRAQIQPA